MRDFSSCKLACEGIVGDGCGGGRWFYVEDEKLFAYDPMTKQSLLLQVGIFRAKNISKKGCIITIECEDDNIELDLSSLK